MENIDTHSVPVRYLELTLDLAEGHGIRRATLLDGLALPSDLLDHLRRELPPPPQQADIVSLVRKRLEASPVLPQLDALAEGLHMSPRTLKRRLQHRGTSYRMLADEVRGRASATLLLDRDMNLEAIAERLGYSSAANFSRAFRRWAGMTPGTKRAALLCATAAI